MFLSNLFIYHLNVRTRAKPLQFSPPRSLSLIIVNSYFSAIRQPARALSFRKLPRKFSLYALYLCKNFLYVRVTRYNRRFALTARDFTPRSQNAPGARRAARRLGERAQITFAPKITLLREHCALPNRTLYASRALISENAKSIPVLRVVAGKMRKRDSACDIAFHEIRVHRVPVYRTVW